MNQEYPIIEASCEFSFTPAQSWDMTIPGIFYERIKNNFPVKEQRVGFGIGFSPQQGVVEQKVEVQQRIRFWNKDKSTVIQLAQNLLVINQLRPYIKWELFKPIILDNLHTYVDIVKPKAFKRIALRYINHIIIESYQGLISEYFNFYPSIPSELPKPHGSFNIRLEFPIDNENEILLINFICSSVKMVSQPADFRLELNYILKQPETISFEQAEVCIEKGKKILNNAFKACITEKCRESIKRSEHGIARVQ